MDKRKRGRIGARKTTSLEDRVLARWKFIRRGMKTGAVTSSRGERQTVHLRLAREFGIPCQQVLDIIDPDRMRKGYRERKYAFEQWAHSLYAEWRERYAVLNDENRDEARADYDEIREKIRVAGEEWRANELTLGTNPDMVRS